jgi:hypothetical protein
MFAFKVDHLNVAVFLYLNELTSLAHIVRFTCWLLNLQTNQVNVQMTAITFFHFWFTSTALTNQTLIAFPCIFLRFIFWDFFNRLWNIFHQRLWLVWLVFRWNIRFFFFYKAFPLSIVKFNLFFNYLALVLWGGGFFAGVINLFYHLYWFNIGFHHIFHTFLYLIR